MWNEQVKQRLLNPNLTVKQDILLPKSIKYSVLKDKKKLGVGHIVNPLFKMSRIIWMGP